MTICGSMAGLVAAAAFSSMIMHVALCSKPSHGLLEQIGCDVEHASPPPPHLLHPCTPTHPGA